MYTYVATFLIGLVMSGISVWKVQDWRYASKEKERVESQLENERLRSKAITADSNRVIQAQNDAANRAVALRRDADGARAALIGLSNATDSAMRAAADSHQACIDRTASLSKLLNTMAAVGGRISEASDRHVSDIKTLEAAGWPPVP